MSSYNGKINRAKFFCYKYSGSFLINNFSDSRKEEEAEVDREKSNAENPSLQEWVKNEILEQIRTM